MGQPSLLFPLTINVHASPYPHSSQCSPPFPLPSPPLMLSVYTLSIYRIHPLCTSWVFPLEDGLMKTLLKFSTRSFCITFLPRQLTWSEERKCVQSQLVSLRSRCCGPPIKQGSSSARVWQTGKQGLYGLSKREGEKKKKWEKIFMGLYTSQIEHMHSYKSTITVQLCSAGMKNHMLTAAPCRVWCKQWHSRSKDRIRRVSWGSG